ncbi:caspase family protein [Streptomyces sp. V4-01]|uniref:Caspase family protein n=1 Tax=Actinacidiphila polyblastidii TaxID=3110430 RepID=A0ABU7PDE8_9ACTN|nr:caspase family protein [Streptomyces sp. V4-01]
MELADPQRSFAVLIGAARYAAPALEDLPAVANNLTGLRDLLQDPQVWGLPESHCTLIPEPASPADVLDGVHAAAQQAQDTLLVYYAGHGLAHPDVNGLLLSLPGTDPERPYTALDFDAVRREVLGAGRGVNRVVVLDCCYGGRAFEGGMSGAVGAVQVAEQTRIAGSYLLTASAATRQAQAPPGEEYTAFTGELIHLLEGGLPGGESVIEVSRIYEHLHAELRSKGRPLPQQRLSNTGRTMAFVRNRYGAGGGRPAPADPVATVPNELRQILRRRPRDIVEAVRALRDGGSAAGTELLAYAGALRPVQEVATMLWLLPGEENLADRDVLCATVARRDPHEIGACLEALHALEGVDGAERRLLEEVARRPTQSIAATVQELRAWGFHEERGMLLDFVRAGLRTTDDVLDLLGAMWSAGLDGDAEGLLRTAVVGSPEEAVVLADALLTIDRPDEAFALYLAHAPVVAGRPVTETTRVLQVMTEAGRDDAARQLLEAAVATNPPGIVAELCESLSSVGLDPLAAMTARAAASADTRAVRALADELRDRGRDANVLHLVQAAIGRCPLLEVPQLVDTLREMGRPVDANRLIATAAAERAPEEVVLLWRWFAGRRRARDGDLLIAGCDTRSAGDRLAMLAMLCAERREASVARGVKGPPPAPVADEPLLASVLESLVLVGDDDLLATLKVLRETDQPLVLHAFLAALVRQDPETAVEDMERLHRLRYAPESAVLRALLADAGTGGVRDLDPGDVRTALGRVSTRPEECVYAMAALCAAGREAAVISSLLGVTHAARARVTGQLLLLMRRQGLEGCARALIREQAAYFAVQYPGGWGLLLQQLADDDLDEYLVFARSLGSESTARPEGGGGSDNSPATAEHPRAEGRRRWFRGRGEPT